MAAIVVDDLRKSYGKTHAVQGVSFAVEEGACVALLGPNGAGKTTTLEVLEGYLHRDGGRVEVLGKDPQHADRALARADRHRAAGHGGRPVPDGARDPHPHRGLLPPSPRGRRGHRARRTDGEGRLADQQALRRAAAPPRRRLRHHRQPEAALPRRADHRLRPLCPPRRLGHGQRAARCSARRSC